MSREPLLDPVLGGLGLDDVQPVPAGPGLGVGGDDLHHVVGLQGIIEAHHVPVDFGVLGMVAYVGVDAVGEVEGRAADGQIQDLPLGRQHVNVLAQVVLHHVLGELGAVLAVVPGFVHHMPEPAGALVHLGLDGAPLLVHPVGGHAVFRSLVHLMGPDLDLEGDAVLVHEGGVQ